MQVDSGVLEALMSHQQLNGSQVCAGLEQMCSKAVSESVRPDPLRDASTLRGCLTDVPHGLIRDRLFGFASADLAREQIYSRLLPSPVLAQFLQELRRERYISIAQREH